MLLALFGCSIQYNVGFDAAPNTATFGVLARAGYGADDGVDGVGSQMAVWSSIIQTFTNQVGLAHRVRACGFDVIWE